MRISLRTRVLVLVTLVIVIIGVITTALFTAAFIRSEERGLVKRGTALSYALSRAAEEGLVNEDLNLIKKASDIIKAPDVTVVQVYSDLWDAIEAYPVDRLNEPAQPQAVAHFSNSDEPFSIQGDRGYDFYRPIFFMASKNSTPITIGFVRLSLSSSSIRKELREIIVADVAVSGLITLLAIISIDILIGRFVIKPVTGLYRSVSLFKDGILPEEDVLNRQPGDEIQELSREFTVMCNSLKEKEDRLVESEKRVRSLFERVEHAIFRLDARGSVLEANSRFREMFGDVAGICDIFADQSGIDCLGETLPEKGVHFERRAVGRNGEERNISLSLYPEIDAGGSLTGMDGYIIDVTEKKRLEERLIRAQKMEAVGTLAGGMAHDFNNLLTAILGYSEIILSMTGEGDPFHRPAAVIHDAAQRGADFGRKILSLTRKEKIETKAVNINDVVYNSMELLQHSIPKKIEIVTRLADGVPLIKADPSQIQQVIINLAVNARDAMPEGGRLLIETSMVGSENGAANSLDGAEGGFIKLSVSDTGAGMDRATQGKIFDPFFTTKETGKGTGLGLYIVHSIVTNHGGYINLYSEPSQGTRFNIYMPVAKEEVSEGAELYHDLRGSGTILVVDDEPDVRELFRDMLEPLGYTIITAEGGNDAIRIYREMRDRISLVVLDMIMPKMGGNEVFQVLKTVNPEVRILLCSGYSRNGFSAIEEILKQGALGFVQKPFSRRTIALSLKKALSA
jgi:two-component system, cell cycle sensor histidine kinase and response regulator CckA